MLSSSAKKAFKKAYLESRYDLFFPAYTIRIGQIHPDLDEFLIDNNAFTWAFVSAYNPFSKSLSLEENEVRHANFIHLLQAKSFDFCEGQGVGSGWEPEKSVFILDISLEKAIELGQHFEQNALIFGMVNRAATLVWCEG